MVPVEGQAFSGVERVGALWGSRQVDGSVVLFRTWLAAVLDQHALHEAAIQEALHTIEGEVVPC